MKKLISIFLCAVIVCGCILLASCDKDDNYPVTIDGITVDKEPENIVILDKNIADIISSISPATV